MSMRSLINLVESGPNFVAIIQQAAWDEFLSNVSQNDSELDSYVERYEDDTGNDINVPPQERKYRGSELKDPEFLAWCQERVAERALELTHEFQHLAAKNHGMIRAWRAVEAPPDWKPTGPNCGIHWSRTRAMAQPIFGIGEAGHIVHVVEADIPLSSIDWEATTRANLSQEFGADEDEVTIGVDAPVQVRKVYKGKVSKRRPIDD